MNRRTAPMWLLGLSAALSAATAAAAPPDRHDRTADGFRNMIAGLRTGNDLRGIQRVGEEVRAAWRATKSPAYYPAILDVCLAMNSTRTTEPGVNEAIGSLALEALDAPGEKPVGVTARLLLFLHGDPDYSTGKLTGEAWATERRKTAERWMRGWRSVRDQNAALPYPTELPLNRVPHPGALVEGVGGPPIKDPVKRKEYEAAVERNHRLHEAHRAKRNLQDLEEDIEGDATRYLTDAYSRPPFRTDELHALLAGLGSTKDRRAIL
ncbi:MAG TPA: hypothetical protein VD866_11365, partial [Urbifossiella sp.]|nr:hypothetical protein [Urbifossiella sp.]